MPSKSNYQDSGTINEYGPWYSRLNGWNIFPLG